MLTFNGVFSFSLSLDKILAAMTIAAERNNKERFAPIVEGLENHEAQQLQVSSDYECSFRTDSMQI